MLQVRVSLPSFSSGVNFTDSVILERAENIQLTKTVNSSDESISFTLPTSDPKISYISYLRWWECWDTATGERLNYGPIRNITTSSNSGEKTVTGPGRSSLLEDFYLTTATWGTQVQAFFDDLRFENMAVQPRTRTIIDKSNTNPGYGLSLRTKDSVIDEDWGWLKPGEDHPYQGTVKTTNFWAGTAKADALTLDLGSQYTIEKARVLMPWWSGVTINNGRTYDWNLKTSDDNSSYTTIYTSPSPNEHATWVVNGGQNLYFGIDADYVLDTIEVSDSPITARYFKYSITNTHALYGGNPTLIDEWDWECAGSDNFDGAYKPSPTDGTIPTKDVGPENDCYASIIELGLMRKIIGRDIIKPLSYMQIENDNLAITYYHEPEASEMIDTGTSTIKKFEPGAFFRKVRLTWNGGSITVKDEYNTIVYTGGSTGTDVLVNLPAFTRVLQISGTSDIQVSYCDAWQAKLDPFSFGASYSYTEVQDDYAVLTVRGTSLKWYATVPNGSSAGQAKIEIREKDPDTGAWSGWTTLVASMSIPVNIAGQKIWEIEEGSGILEDSITYEVRITNLNGGYVSIDSFAGYWEASFAHFNEDDPRFSFRKPAELVQIYDSKWSGGSIYQYNAHLAPAQSFRWVGDRVIVYSYKHPVNAGMMRLSLYRTEANGSYNSGRVPIPGGDGDGYLTINLGTAYEVPQAIVFDTNDYFTGSNALPWGEYWFAIYTEHGELAYLDGVSAFAVNYISAKFVQTTHLNIIKDTAQALNVEWDINEAGLKIVPMVGVHTNVILKEGTNTTINIQEVQDAEQTATMLITSGGDIDGMPLTTVTEDKLNRQIMGRTIQRLYDLRSVTDYFGLIGASRAELVKRRYPQRRITVEYAGDDLSLSYGDTFIIKTKDLEMRVRANTITRSQSSNSGTTYQLECTEWQTF